MHRKRVKGIQEPIASGPLRLDSDGCHKVSAELQRIATGTKHTAVSELMMCFVAMLNKVKVDIKRVPKTKQHNDNSTS